MKFKVSNSKVMKGTIKINGSKNACLPEMVLCILTHKLVVLENVPLIGDVYMMIEILKACNVKCFLKDHTLFLKRGHLKKQITNAEITKIRASYYLMGAYISISKQFKTKYPGGCAFDLRPINYHLDAFKQMGVEIKERKELIIFKRKKLKPTTINLVMPSVGTTINIILASVKTKGITYINNPSLEPEVTDFIEALNKMNANIVISKKQIIIKGVKKLKGLRHRIIPDRIEAGSYMLLASSVDYSHLLLKDVNTKHLAILIRLLKSLKIKITEEKEGLLICKNQQIKGTAVFADVYPFFPTDLQQIITVCMLKAITPSYISDNIYQKRFSQVKELLKMNASIYINEYKQVIFPSNLKGTTVKATDLRAGFALIIAGCIAENETIIENAELICRGYENIINKLNDCLINIQEVK